MPTKLWLRSLVVVAVFGLLAAACGADDPIEEAAPTTTEASASTDTTDGEGDTFEELIDETPTTTAAPDTPPDDNGGETVEDPEPDPVDICDTATPEDVEIGVSADEIVIVASADVNTPLAPGLFQDAFDGIEAWAEHVNSEGGLACRQVRVEQFDTLLNATESVNAQLFACENALAMVATTALFVFDVTELNTCEDGQGNPIGLPDIAQLTTEVDHQCSANTFSIVPPTGECPYSGGERVYRERVGHIRWYQENINPDLVGVFLIPADLPSTRITTIPYSRSAVENLGLTEVGEYGISGQDLQPVFAEFVQAIEDNGANFARTGSDVVSLVKFRSEAAARGVDVEVWECTISCYDQTIFEVGGGVEDGTYIPILQLPYEEAEFNEELQAYVGAVGDSRSSWSLQAWAAGVLFEEAVAAVIAETGDINAITRQALLDTLNGIDSFNARGMIGDINPGDGVGSPCYVLLQIQGPEFVRIHPEEPGTMHCDPSNSPELVLDASAYVDANLQ